MLTSNALLCPSGSALVYLNIQFYTTMPAQTSDTHDALNMGTVKIMLESLEISVHWPTCTHDGYDSLVASWKLCRERQRLMKEWA